MVAVCDAIAAELHASEDADTILHTAAAQELENRLGVTRNLYLQIPRPSSRECN